MKFYEFGKNNSKSIMLLPGNLMTYRQYETLVPQLSKDYHIIAVSFDGFDETGETYSTAEIQAKKIGDYIRDKLNGKIDLVYAESLGRAPALFLTRNDFISVGGIIVSGTSYWNLGIFNTVAKKLFTRYLITF